MFFRRLINRILKRSKTETAAFDFLHSAERFRALLDNERMRSDRMKSEFVLVVFRMRDSQTGGESHERFALELKSRVRATDHAGRFGKDERDVGVILWDTGIGGAHRFIDGLRQQCSVDALPEHDVYLYPTDPPFFDDDNRPAVQSRDRVIRNRNLHDPLPQAKPTRVLCSKSLEALCVKPLPAWKRGIDVFGAALGLLVLSPLLLLTAALVKITSRGPVLFTQQRDGLGGRRFKIFKFRTMFLGAEARKAELRKHSEQDGPAFKLTNDPRITPLGRYLRKSCIDELPQLWNVLKGDMTLVGPRPLDSREAREITGWGRRRMDVTPGLTCIWQVHGKSRVSFTEWMRMDIRYLTTRTFLRDMRLILQTAVAVVFHKASV